MTQREQLLARLQAMPDESLHQIDTFSKFIQFQYTAMQASSLIPLHSVEGGECLEGVPQGFDLRLDILMRVQLGFRRLRRDRANTLTLHEIYVRSGPKLTLDRPSFHEILVELSSPLVGYLGREEGVTTDSDQFWIAAIYVAGA